MPDMIQSNLPPADFTSPAETDAPPSAATVARPLRRSASEGALAGLAPPARRSAAVPPAGRLVQRRNSLPAVQGTRARASIDAAPTAPAPIPTDDDRRAQPSPAAQPAAVTHADEQPTSALESLGSTTAPRRAGLPLYMTMQAARHLVPVAGVRTAVQGLAAPAVARMIETHPDGALASQIALTTWSLVRQLGSTWHSEARADAATRAFLGETTGSPDHTSRRVWQGIQRTGALACDIASLILTALARTHPDYVPIAQAMLAIQVRGHLLSSGRELLHPTINTVRVGHPDAPLPANGGKLRPSDLTASSHLVYGGAVATIEFVSQMLMQVVLGGRTAWDAGLGLATAAGAIAGLANAATSSVEDTLIDNAVERNLQTADERHVRSVHWSSHNPFSNKELARQLERVDVRTFNQFVPAMIAAGVLHAISLDSEWHERAATAGINALLNGVILGGLMSVTARSYQTSDALR